MLLGMPIPARFLSAIPWRLLLLGENFCQSRQESLLPLRCLPFYDDTLLPAPAKFSQAALVSPFPRRHVFVLTSPSLGRYINIPSRPNSHLQLWCFPQDINASPDQILISRYGVSLSQARHMLRQFDCRCGETSTTIQPVWTRFSSAASLSLFFRRDFWRLSFLDEILLPSPVRF